MSVAGCRSVGRADDFPFGGRPRVVADAQLHRQDTQLRRPCWLTLFLRTRASPLAPDQPYFCLSRRTSARALWPDLQLPHNSSWPLTTACSANIAVKATMSISR